ncbi:coiled-coil domain-containing protein 114 [Xenentodon cancila]
MERHRPFNARQKDRIRKQQQEIERLLKEQEELRQNLAAHNRFCHRQQDKKDIQRFKDLLQQRDILDEKLQKVKQSQEEIRRKKVELKKEVVTREPKQMKAKHTLEDKLYRATTHFDELVVKKKQVREEVKNLYTERAQFLQLRSKLNKELQEVKKKICETRNLCTTAYDKRMEVKSMITITKKRIEEESVQDYNEIARRERLKSHELSLKNFMRIKCRTRSMQDDKLTHKQLLEMREKKKDNSGENENETTRIQTVTGEDNVDLDTASTQVMDQNSALLSFINEQNRYIETQKNDISQIQNEMKQLQVKAAQQEQDHRCFVSDIDEQIKETQSQAEDYDHQVNSLNSVLDGIKTGINSILSKMEFDCSVIDDKLGCSGGITDDNIMMFLGLVEQQMNELLSIQAFLHSKDLKKDYSSKDLTKYLLGQHPKLIQQSLGLQQGVSSKELYANEPPITHEEEQPLSQEELRRRIMNDVIAKKDLQKEELAYREALKSSTFKQ